METRSKEGSSLPSLAPSTLPRSFYTPLLAALFVTSSTQLNEPAVAAVAGATTRRRTARDHLRADRVRRIHHAARDRALSLCVHLPRPQDTTLAIESGRAQLQADNAAADAASRQEQQEPHCQPARAGFESVRLFARRHARLREEEARAQARALHAWSAPAPGLRASVWRRPIDLLRLQPPRPRQPKHARACVRPPRRSVPRQADATSASRAKVDPVRVHLDSALQALDELAYDEKPAASKEARPFLPTLALASSPYAHPTLAATLTYGETPSPTKTARLLPHQPSPSLATSPSYQP